LEVLEKLEPANKKMKLLLQKPGFRSAIGINEEVNL